MPILNKAKVVKVEEIMPKDSQEEAPKKERRYKLRKVSISRDLLRHIDPKEYIQVKGKKYLKLKSGIYVQGFLPRRYPSSLAFGFINEFISTKYPTTIGIYLRRYDDDAALGILNSTLTVIRGERRYYEHMGLTGSQKYRELQREEAVLEDLRSRIVAKMTHYYDATFAVAVRGVNYAELQENAKRVKVAFRGLNFKLHRGFYRMWEILRAMLPIDQREIPFYQPMNLDLESAATFFPFTSGAFSTLGPNSVLFGFNDANDTPVFVDLFIYPSHNMMVFGATGSGKSYFSKLLAVRSRIANPQVRIYAIDPLGEYGELFEEMGGVNVDLWNPYGVGEVINPLDPRLGKDVHEMVGNTIRLFTTLFEISREEKIFLDSVLHKLYTSYEGEEPIFGDLIEVMSEQIEVIRRVEGESAVLRYEKLLNSLRIFDNGSLSFLNRPSTVDISEQRYVNFNLHGTPEDYLPFFMFFVTNYIYSHLQRVDGEKLFIIDEAQHIWRYPAVAERVEWVARHIRHYRGSLIMMTQSANDGFLNRHTKAMMENAYVHLLLRHEALGDDARQFYKLMDAEESIVYNAHGGKGFGYSTGLLHIGGMMNIPLRIMASPEEDRFLHTG